MDLMPYKENRIDGQTVLTVNGRDIHRFLEVPTNFPHWVTAQIRRAHLTENVDYVVLAEKSQNPQGGRPTNEYHFTFEAAKHICMRSSTDKGHEIRRYFLACEKKWQSAQHRLLGDDEFPDLLAIMNLVRTVAEHRRQMAALEERTEEANANSLLAMRGQQWVTIRQYVTIHHLQRQVPPSLQQQYGRWLAGLCRERGIPVYIQRSQEYEENTYWCSVIEETLPGWLGRRGGQSGLGLA